MFGRDATPPTSPCAACGLRAAVELVDVDDPGTPAGCRDYAPLCRTCSDAAGVSIPVSQLKGRESC